MNYFYTENNYDVLTYTNSCVNGSAYSYGELSGYVASPGDHSIHVDGVGHGCEHLVLTFISDDSVTKQGFSISYEVVCEDNCTECAEGYYLVGEHCCKF